MKQVMLGNEAIARGAYEAGCSVASAYPGTPSTEILQNLSKYKEVYSEWSVNEKVAAEVAIGASMAGARAMAAMKHFGMNVASDAVFPSVYIGATGGLVYVCADDPGMNSSGTEPDSRHFAPHMKMPMLEPADSQECKDFTKRAFELSEQFDTPFMLRTTVRVNHGSSIVTLEDRVEVPVKHYERDIMKNTNIPALARNKHKTVEERLVRLQEFSNETDLNRVELHDTKIGVICAGICYQYAREVFGDGASYLKLGFTYPMPDRKIREFAAQVDKLYVLEELDPFIEDYVRGLGIECTGKAVLPLYLEYSADIIRRALGLPGVSAAYEAPVQAPVRPASFCAGCPHRGIYHEISKYNGKIVATGDTVAQCEANYRRILAEKGLVSADDADLPLTGQNEVSGVLEDIRSAVVDGNTLYYLRLTGDEHYYVISAAQQPEVVIFNVGDSVAIRYAEGEGTILTADSVTRTVAQTSPVFEETETDGAA